MSMHSHFAEPAAVPQPDGLTPLAIVPTRCGSGRTFSDSRLITATVACATLVLLYAAASYWPIQPLIDILRAQRWAQLIAHPSVWWAAMFLTLFGFRAVLWLRYRPFASADVATAPRLTVVIPAYNQGRMVRETIDSVARAPYPRGRIEIIVVDDGSSDDTWHHIECSAEQYPGLVVPLRLHRNRGKRAALAAGFARARGEIVVAIDSDSVIVPEALLAIAGPFRDARVGAVAGKIEVLNRREGLIPRMLQVRYLLAFDALPAAQSTYGTVACCPGAFSAFRLLAIRRLLRPWLRQTFLGARCTHGEDRALTNLVLASGYDTVYQRGAIAFTTVPRGYAKLCRMYLRWCRTYLREQLRFYSYTLWWRPSGTRTIALVDGLIACLRYPLAYLSLAPLVIFALDHPLAILRLLASIGVVSLLNSLYCLRSERSWSFLFGVAYAYFATFALFWIVPYAALTVRSRSWMTR